MEAAMQQTHVKTRPLRIIQVDYGKFYVESSDGKMVYLVTVNGHTSCTCSDFINLSKDNPTYRCEHILAVLSTDADMISSLTPVDTKTPKLDERFIANINGKEFALYAGLLDLGHQKGIRRIEVEAVQFPNEENGFTAVCKCTLESNRGEIYVEWGDASPDNVNKKIARHIIRMAATRAKARALRDYTNVGMTSLEELGDVEDNLADTLPPRHQRDSADHSVQRREPDITPLQPLGSISDAQLRALNNLARRKGISAERLDAMSRERFNTSIERLSSSDAGAFIRNLQTAS